MKSIAFVILTFFSTNLLAKTPLEVVNERMAAHNSHDLERFLNTYSENIQIYDYPNTPLGKPGKAHLTKIFAPLFNAKSVNTKVKNQMVNGNIVINRETVTSRGKTHEYISVYEIEANLIKSVRFIK